MRDNLFSGINVQEKNINIPNCQARDSKAEAQRYEDLIRSIGGIDFQYISLGVNGHMAYNEPGTSLKSTTHVAKLTPETIVDMVNKGKFSTPEESPKYAITMGVETLVKYTKKVIMVSYGQHKAGVTRIMIEETPNIEVTASALQNHPDCTYILDAGAASKLSPEVYARAEKR
jgi:glucosamine-6-phosphate deaminase